MMVHSKTNRIFDVGNALFMLLVIVITRYPFIYTLSVSLSSATFVKANQIVLLPKGLNVEAYKQVFENTFFWNSYWNTIVYTVVGTAISLVLTCGLAFCLSRRDLICRGAITFFVTITMFVSGGLIPSFLLVKELHLYNTLWALVLPTAISTYNMIIVRTYMQGLPFELTESARIDGANDLQILTRIILPLSVPVIATIGLFYAVGYWNNYFTPMIYLKDRAKFPLQLLLKEMIINEDLQGMAQGARDAMKGNLVNTPTSNMLICASMITAMIPIICVYPFIQKYFVKGVMVGSLKG